MEKLFKYLNKTLNNKFKSLLFFGGDYSKQNNTLNLVFNCLNGENLIEENEETLSTSIEKFFDNKVKVVVKLKNYKFDEELVEKNIKAFFEEKKEMNYVFNVKDIKITKNGEEYCLIMPVQENFLSNNIKQNLLELVEFEFGKYGIDCPEIKYQTVENNDSQNVLQTRMQKNGDATESLQEDNVQILDVENIIGEIAECDNVILATDKLEVVKNLTVCGVIEGFRLREFTKNDKTKKMASFKLVDKTKKVDCVCFSKDIEKIEDESTLNGKEAVVLCDVDDFNGKKSLKVKNIALCKIKRPEIVFKEVNADYLFVKPEKFVELSQANFLDEQEVIKNKDLLDKSFVVFDLETTGLDTQTCSIVEIGAVKIVKGKIVETFDTLVNPEEHIPEEASSVNHITDDMVANAPTIKQALPDFYKFCDGCCMVGHNGLGYDVPIIKRVGVDCLYNFSHEQMDTYIMAKKYLKGLPKYKLGSLCEYYNISLEGAHRALNDTVATAKLFVKLMENFC